MRMTFLENGSVQFNTCQHRNTCDVGAVMLSCAGTGCKGKGREVGKPKQDCDSKRQGNSQGGSKKSRVTHTWQGVKLKAVALEFAAKEVTF